MYWLWQPPVPGLLEQAARSASQVPELSPRFQPPPSQQTCRREHIKAASGMQVARVQPDRPYNRDAISSRERL